MTHCDFSVRSARDEMRHIVSEAVSPMSSLDLTKIRTGDAKQEGQRSHGILRV